MVHDWRSRFPARYPSGAPNGDCRPKARECPPAYHRDERQSIARTLAPRSRKGGRPRALVRTAALAVCPSNPLYSRAPLEEASIRRIVGSFVKRHSELDPVPARGIDPGVGQQTIGRRRAEFLM
jgi:hypothetical protein